ncbi:MAG: glycosyltransferase, partial [Anaerolineales bacterium]|nr:glycosyltransferase [Anaerolineales bacterium]
MISKNNKGKHIAMVLTNAFRPDPRVLKEARSLIKAGYTVTVVCWDRQGELPAQEDVDGFQVRRLSIKSTYAAGSRQIFYLPRFWKAALRELRNLDPQIIHCHDLDTTPVGYWYSLFHHTPWIFDSHECYPYGIGPQVNRPLYYTLLFLERFMARRAPRTITVGELLAERLRGFKGRVSVVGNYQSLDTFNSNRQMYRADLGLQTDSMVIVYAGGFTYPRALVPLIEATQLVEKVEVILIGDGPQRKAIEALLPDHPKVQYLGWLSQDKVYDYTNFADVIYYSLDINHPHSR